MQCWNSRAEKICHVWKMYSSVWPYWRSLFFFSPSSQMSLTNTCQQPNHQITDMQHIWNQKSEQATTAALTKPSSSSKGAVNESKDTTSPRNSCWGNHGNRKWTDGTVRTHVGSFSVLGRRNPWKSQPRGRKESIMAIVCVNVPAPSPSDAHSLSPFRSLFPLPPSGRFCV